MTLTLPERIVELSDAGEQADAIADECECSPGYVYRILRDVRPDRKRKPRRLTAELPGQIRHLAKSDIKPARIAFLLDCSVAYVYRVLQES